MILLLKLVVVLLALIGIAVVLGAATAYALGRVSIEYVEEEDGE
jgi:membrane protein YqaA with SNARE-associated domain